MRKVLIIVVACLLGSCFDSAYQRNYIISQYSEEENQEKPPQESADIR